MAYTELYHLRHLCACGANISHSQGDFDAHKFHGGFVTIYPGTLADAMAESDGLRERAEREGVQPDTRTYIPYDKE